MGRNGWPKRSSLDVRKFPTGEGDGLSGKGNKTMISCPPFLLERKEKEQVVPWVPGYRVRCAGGSWKRGTLNPREEEGKKEEGRKQHIIEEQTPVGMGRKRRGRRK